MNNSGIVVFDLIILGPNSILCCSQTRALRLISRSRGHKIRPHNETKPTGPVQGPSHVAPRASSARRSSLTAVGTSSKLSAEMAHLACFWACDMAMSSAVKLRDTCWGT